MSEPSTGHHVLAEIVGAAALGAFVMYLLDPDRGRRRRALMRDRTRRIGAEIGHFFCVAARDASNRLDGLRARARRLARRPGDADDLMVIERVRSAMGRVVSHPHAIQIGALDGRVTLSGPILTDEIPSLLAAVRSVSGVDDIENRLVPHHEAGSVPSLQGGVARGASNGWSDPWPPALRMAAVVAGGAMTLYGLRQGHASGAMLVGVGALLTARGATEVPTARWVQTLQSPSST